MKFRKGLLAGLALSAVLAGCATNTPTAGVLAPMAPPAPQPENVGTAPTAGDVWVAGSYTWTGRQYVWERGRWESPRAGYHYVQRSWVREGDGWREHGGRWEKAG